MNRLLTFAACVGLTAIAFAPAARADEWNKRTVMTINQPIQVPNRVLPPGKYVVRLLDSPSDRHIVQIYDENEQHLITTVLAMPNYRLEPSGKTVFTFWETPPGQPPALRAWFYPGDNYGQEFAYPKSVATQIAAVAHAPVPTTEATQQQEFATAPVTSTPPPAEQPQQQERQEVAQNTPPPAPAPAPEVSPAPERTAPPQELPKTASPYPLIGLAGASLLSLFALLRAFRSA